MLNEGNQIHNFISSSGSGTVINYGSGSGSDFLTSYCSGSGSTRQKVTVPTVPVPVPVPQHCYIYHCSDHHADGPAAEAGEPGPAADAVPRAGHLLPPRDGGVRGRLRHRRDPQHRGQHPQLLQATQPPGQQDFSTS
jgi:hypothetical protein